MTGWSSSHFLQSLGWAILNSIWQMALLWIAYLVINHLFKLSAAKKYQVSVAGIGVGFIWFLITFFYYLQTSPVSSIAFFNRAISESNSLLQTVLLSASVSYLVLLVFPAYKLYRNWKFVQNIKKEGLSKADPVFRLFVQKIAAQLGITKKVVLYASELVKSPVTIGYLKPMILVPIAALNNLSSQQVEAILLHELSHIRRFDYLINFMISIIHTILYFNPFVKLFMRSIEEERENCCDELVLQFGYDKVGYASALLTLEKLSGSHQALALCARGKNYLLNRIEKIVGMEKKKGFRLNHFAGLLAALLCIVVFNSVMIIREQKPGNNFVVAYEQPGNLFNLFPSYHEEEPEISATTIEAIADLNVDVDHPSSPVPPSAAPAIDMEGRDEFEAVQETQALSHAGNMFVQVAQNDIDAQLTKEEKEEVKKTVKATKEILTALEWNEVEAQIADAMTEAEKARAHQEFMKAFEARQELANLEQNLKAMYQDLNWDQININMNQALINIRLDSVMKVYTQALVQLEKAKAQAKAKGVIAVTPMPDRSVEEMQASADEIRIKLERIKEARNPKKTISL